MIGETPKYTQKEQNVMRTRKALYDAAMSMFKEYGYENVKIEDITRVAGTSKGTFYTHFNSKAQILFEHYAQIDIFFHQIEKDFDKIDGTMEKLLYFLSKHAEYIENVVTINTIRIIYTHQVDGDPANLVLDRSQPGLAILQQIIEQGQQSGELIDSSSALEIGSYISYLVRGLIYSWLLSNGSMNLLEKAKKYYPIALRMFTKQG